MTTYIAAYGPGYAPCGHDPTDRDDRLGDPLHTT